MLESQLEHLGEDHQMHQLVPLLIPVPDPAFSGIPSIAAIEDR